MLCGNSSSKSCGHPAERDSADGLDTKGCETSPGAKCTSSSSISVTPLSSKRNKFSTSTPLLPQQFRHSLVSASASPTLSAPKRLCLMGSKSSEANEKNIFNKFLSTEDGEVIRRVKSSKLMIRRQSSQLSKSSNLSSDSQLNNEDVKSQLNNEDVKRLQQKLGQGSPLNSLEYQEKNGSSDVTNTLNCSNKPFNALDILCSPVKVPKNTTESSVSNIRKIKTESPNAETNSILSSKTDSSQKLNTSNVSIPNSHSPQCSSYDGSGVNASSKLSAIEKITPNVKFTNKSSLSCVNLTTPNIKKLSVAGAEKLNILLKKSTPCQFSCPNPSEESAVSRTVGLSYTTSISGSIGMLSKFIEKDVTDVTKQNNPINKQMNFTSCAERNSEKTVSRESNNDQFDVPARDTRNFGFVSAEKLKEKLQPIKSASPETETDIAQWKNNCSNPELEQYLMDTSTQNICGLRTDLSQDNLNDGDFCHSRKGSKRKHSADCISEKMNKIIKTSQGDQSSDITTQKEVITSQENILPALQRKITNRKLSFSQEVCTDINTPASKPIPLMIVSNSSSSAVRSPKGLEPHCGSPKGLKPHCGSPKGLESHCGSPKGLESHCGSPKGLESHCGSPKGFEPHCGSPKGFEPHCGSPKGLEPHCGSPKGLEPHCGFPGFSTGGGRKLFASENAVKRAKSIWSSCLNDQDKDALEIPTHESVKEKTAISHASAVEKSEGNCCGSLAPLIDSFDYPKSEFSAPGFSTAGGKSVNVSSTALKKAQTLWNDCLGDSETQLNRPKNFTTEKSVSSEKFAGFSTAAGNSLQISESALNKASSIWKDCNNTCVEENEQVPRPIPSVGFATAAGKSIAITQKSLSKSKKLWNECGEISRGDLERFEAHSLNMPSSSTKAPISGGFSTASGNNIKINEGALRKAQKLWALGVDEAILDADSKISSNSLDEGKDSEISGSILQSAVSSKNTESPARVTPSRRQTIGRSNKKGFIKHKIQSAKVSGESSGLPEPSTFLSKMRSRVYPPNFSTNSSNFSTNKLTVKEKEMIDEQFQSIAKEFLLDDDWNMDEINDEYKKVEYPPIVEVS